MEFFYRAAKLNPTPFTFCVDFFTAGQILFNKFLVFPTVIQDVPDEGVIKASVGPWLKLQMNAVMIFGPNRGEGAARIDINNVRSPGGLPTSKTHRLRFVRVGPSDEKNIGGLVIRKRSTKSINTGIA